MRRSSSDAGPSGTSMHDRAVCVVEPEPPEPTKFGILKKYLKDRLPILKWLPNYTRQEIIPDAVAGITVGLTAIPQSMAYAGVAGLTPEFGLYSSFMSCFVYIFLGSCRQMTIGPTAVIELLTYETCGQNYAPCVILTGFYVGCIQLLMGLCYLGLVVSVISEPVTIGFVGGAAVTICSSQVQTFLGLKGPKGKGLIGVWKSIVNNISTATIGDTCLGLACVVFLCVLKNLKDWIKPTNTTKLGQILGKLFWILSISRNALVVLISMCIAFIWSQRSQPLPFAITGSVKSGFPPVRFPPFELPLNSNSSNVNGTELEDWNFFDKTTNATNLDVWESIKELGTGPLSIAVISILQNVAIAKAFGSGQSINANQEMIALGVSHIVGSFFSAIPTSGSFTRSAVNEASGVKSPIGGIFTGMIVILALSFLTPSFYYIPKATLAAVIFSAVLPMIEYQSMRPMWRVSRLDVLACSVTFFASLFLGMEYGIGLGVLTSLIIYLYRPVRPKLEWCKVDYPSRGKDVITDGYICLQPQLGISFTNIDWIRTSINEMILRYPIYSYVVIDCINIKTIDYTAANALGALYKSLKKSNKNLLFYQSDERWVDLFISVGFPEYSGLIFHDLNLLESVIKARLRISRQNKALQTPESQRLLPVLEETESHNQEGSSSNIP